MEEFMFDETSILTTSRIVAVGVSVENIEMMVANNVY